MTGPTMTMPTLTGHGQVTWADTDASGWIHFTAALRWVENTEHAVYRELGAEPGHFPRKNVEVEYNFPFRAGMPYQVQLRLERFGRTSLTWGWSIHQQPADGRDVTGKPAVTGRFTVVHMGPQGRPAELPPELSVLKSTMGSDTPQN